MIDPELERSFPRLRGAFYQVTSPRTPGYNCIAWAAGDTSRWWWPDEFGLYYWPDTVPRHSTLDALIQAFGTLGFEVCKDSGVEAGWEKVAIYAKNDGSPTHAARQLADGTWTSKLGPSEDINHAELEHLNGQVYGSPVLFLHRPLPP